MGTQATFRYLPNYRINDQIGETKYFGWGIQHNPTVWIPGDFPFDLSASFFSQTISEGQLNPAWPVFVPLDRLSPFTS